MDNSAKNQKSKSFDEVVYNDCSEEQKDEIRKAFVEGKKAEARKANNDADNAETSNKKTEAETKKLKIEAGVAIGGLAILAISTILSNVVPCIELEKNRIHHDEEVARYSDNEREVESTVTRGLISRMLRH